MCTPPGACLPVWCGTGRTDQLPQFCQSRRCYFKRTSFNFPIRRPQWAEARRTADLVSGPPGGHNPSPWRASPVKGGLGGDAYEHWRKPSAHRRRPPVTLKVNCPEGAREGGLGYWLLCRRGQSNTVPHASQGRTLSQNLIIPVQKQSFPPKLSQK